jgi:3-deoxy-manno-octulosonate cytidylyltransferase (CMP-KDO synthetase)
MKIYGFVPARMAASRFPGKPLHPILGRPMIEHCFERAKLYDRWEFLALATCDQEILKFGEEKNYTVLMTSEKHSRALDRVAEAVNICGEDITENDIVLCVQGDEPLLGPDLIDAVVKPFQEDANVNGTMLAVPIMDEETYKNTDTVKLVHNIQGDVLYTSRSPIPYTKNFSSDLGAKRVGGIFGFKWHFLRWFANSQSSPLEIIESCDSNRIYDHGFTQRISLMPPRPYHSVDSPQDIARVEKVIMNDPYWGKY